MMPSWKAKMGWIHHLLHRHVSRFVHVRAVVKTCCPGVKSRWPCSKARIGETGASGPRVHRSTSTWTRVVNGWLTALKYYGIVSTHSFVGLVRFGNTV